MALNAVTLSSGELYDAANNKLVVKYAKADVALSQTDSAIVAAVASKKIRVLSYSLSSAGAANTSAVFTTKPAGAGTAKSAVHLLALSGQHHASFNPSGHFETVAGEGLSLTTGAGGQVGVTLSYVEVA